MSQQSESAGKAVNNLLGDIRSLIDSARGQVAQTVNAGLTMLYWHIGRRVRREILKERRAKYGAKILQTLSAKLVPEYGPGFGERNLARMIRLAEVFPDQRILSAVRTKLSWTHFRSIIALDDPLKREFYAEMCRIERWNSRTLDRKIAGMLFERSAIAKKPAKLAAMELKALREEDRLTPDLVFRDPYVLDFLKLKGAYQEKDVEAAILRDMESFILELGTGFAFVARQKRISIGPDDFYLDLLFYHRGLRRLVAVELKLERFRAEHKGQMELYLRWLDRHERQAGEEHPIGLILCAGKSEEQVELLQMDRSGIRVSAYMTELPSRAVLERKLRELISAARARLDCSPQ